MSSWNSNLPQNNTKIRDYPTVLTNNFNALEKGDLTLKNWQVNLIERNSVPGAPPPTNDPTRSDDTMIVFCKQDSSGETELFVMDDRNPANIIQFTENGNMGSQNTPIYGSSISFDGGTSSMNGIHQVSGWLRVAANGSIISTSGDLTVVKSSTGLYTIGFSVAPANTNFVGIAVPANPSSRRSISCENYTSTTFQVRIYSNSTGKNEDEPFQVVVFGGR